MFNNINNDKFNHLPFNHNNIVPKTVLEYSFSMSTRLIDLYLMLWAVSFEEKVKL